MDTSRRQDLIPVKRDFALPRHDPEQLRPLVDATLTILERTGVRCDAPAARSRSSPRRAPPSTATAEGPVVGGTDPGGPTHAAVHLHALCARSAARPAARADVSYMTTDGCGTEVIDRDRPRVHPRSDLVELTRLQDYRVDPFWWPTVGAGDRGATAQVHEIEVGLDWTEKHLMGMVQGERLARAAVDMARAVAGGAEELRRRPLISDLIGTVSPLVLDRDATGAALVCAEAGVPVCFVTMPTLGTTAPATRPGAWAVGAAELVAGAVLLQLAYPGCPVLGSLMQSNADPRTGGTLTWPLHQRAPSARVELLHAFGLPTLAGAGGTDGPMAGGWQDGSEMALGLFRGLFDGAELLTGGGLVNVYQLSAPESLLLGDDIYRHVCDLLRGEEATDETLALATVDEVGPGGHYLGARHTRATMRRAVVRGLAHQPSEAGLGYRDPVVVARERTDEILAE